MIRVSDKSSNSIKKASAIFLCVLIAALMLMSAYFLAHESMHHCDDEDCRICECIRLCKEALQRGADNSGAAVLMLLFGVVLLYDLKLTDLILTDITPVNRKIRLND